MSAVPLSSRILQHIASIVIMSALYPNNSRVHACIAQEKKRRDSIASTKASREPYLSTLESLEGFDTRRQVRALRV